MIAGFEMWSVLWEWGQLVDFRCRYGWFYLYLYGPTKITQFSLMQVDEHENRMCF